MRKLAVGVPRRFCRWFLRFGYFCSRSQPLVRKAFSTSRLLPPLLLPSVSGGITRLGGVCSLLVATASCLLHDRQTFLPSSFLTAARRFCCRRCRTAFGGRISELRHPTISVRVLSLFWLVLVIVIGPGHNFPGPHTTKLASPSYGVKTVFLFSFFSSCQKQISGCLSWILCGRGSLAQF